MACKYCGNETDDRRPTHPECDAEWNRQYDEGRCTRCGDAAAETYGPPHR